MKLKLKKIFKSKMMWFSFLLTIFGALEANFSMLQELLTPAYYGITVTVIGVITAALRWVTTTGLEDK